MSSLYFRSTTTPPQPRRQQQQQQLLVRGGTQKVAHAIIRNLGVTRAIFLKVALTSMIVVGVTAHVLGRT